MGGTIQCKYLNNIIEQDHRRIRWKIKDSMGYQSFKSAYRILRGIEIMHMLRKKQLYHILDQTIIQQKNFVQRRFGLAGSFF